MKIANIFCEVFFKSRSARIALNSGFSCFLMSESLNITFICRFSINFLKNSSVSAIIYKSTKGSVYF